MKFKKGDKVRVLKMPSNCSGEFPEEKIGSIVTISCANGVYCVEDNKWCCNFNESDLETISEFKVGDMVKGISADIEGCEGIIEKIHSNGEQDIRLTKLGNCLWHGKDDWKIGILKKNINWGISIELIESQNEILIPVNDISELKVGDRVKQGGEHLSSHENPYATITKIEGSTVTHIHDDNKDSDNTCDCSGKCFMKVVESTKQEGGAKMDVGDRVRVVEKFDSAEVGTEGIVRGDIYRNKAVEITNAIGSIRLHNCDGKVPNGNGYNIPESNLELVDEIKSEENKMEKPETKLEKNALVKAKKEVVEQEVEAKAGEYRDNMRNFIGLEKNARSYRKQANELAEKLGINEAEKKQLF